MNRATALGLLRALLPILAAAAGGGVGGSVAVARNPREAVIPAQAPQAFTLAVPFQVDVMTNVAIR